MKKDDIESLKQKLIVYKQTLETMKSGNVVEDYLIMKNECYDLIKKIAELKNVMESSRDQHNHQLTNISQQVKILKDEIKSMNVSIEEVKQDVKSLTDKFNSLNIDELMAKMDTLIRDEETLISSVTQEKKEMMDLKEELHKLKSEFLENHIVYQQQIPQEKAKIQPTSYQQLQKIIKSTKSFPNKLPEFSVPFGKDISNFYQGVSKRAQKASFLPPTSPKPQKIELSDQRKEKSLKLKDLKDLKEADEEKSIIISETTEAPPTDELKVKAFDDKAGFPSSLQRSRVDEEQ